MASERIDDIVSQSAIEQLIALGQQLQAVKEQMDGLIVDVAKFSAELNNVGSVREMGTAVNNLNTATNNLNTANKTRLDIEREIKREGAEMAKQVRDEATFYANLDAVMEQHIKTEKTIKEAMNATQIALEENKLELKKLEKQIKGQLISEDAYIAKKAKLSKELEKNKADLSEQRRQLKWIEKDLKAADGSYESLNAQLGQLRAVWKGLSEAERENADVGGVIQAEINRLDEILKGLDKSIGNNQRNVGNYEIASKSAVKELKFLREEFANLSEEERENENVGGVLQARMQALEEEIAESEAMTQKFASTFNTLIRGTFGKAGVIMNKLNAITGATAMTFGKTAVAAVKAFGRQLLKLLANPIVAIISAIALAIMAVVKAFKQNEELMNRLKVVGSALMPIIRGIGKVFEFVAGAIMTAVEWMTKWITTNNEAVELEKERQRIEKNRGKQAMKNAKYQENALKVEEKLKKGNLTLEQRLKYEEELNGWKTANLYLEKQNLTDEINYLKKKGQLSTEEKKELQEKRVALKEINNEITSQRLAYEDQVKSIKEADKAEKDRQRTQAQQKANEELEKSKKLQEQLLELEKQRLEQIKSYKDAYDDLTVKMIEDTKKQAYALYQLNIARILAEKEEAKKFIKTKEDELLINELFDKRLREAHKNYTKSIADIDEKNNEDRLKILQSDVDKQIEQAELSYKLKEGKFKNEFDLQRHYINLAKNLNETAHREGLISDEEYLNNKERLAVEEMELNKAVAVSKLKASQSIIGSITDVMLAGAAQIEDEKKRVKVEQAITMAKVLLTEGLAIAQSVLTNTEGDPYSMIARIVASVATITGTFVTAITAITKAQNAYAEGTDYHKGGSAIVGEGMKNGHWQSEIVETPDGKRFLVDKPTYFSNMPTGTKVIPTEQYGSSVDLGATNSILERIANKGQVVVNVDDKITNYILTKNSRIRVLNSKFKYN